MSGEVKKIADFLRAGATLMSEGCPQCHSPLLKMPSGEVYCANCDKRVVIVKADEEISNAFTPTVLKAVENTLLSKMREAETLMKKESDPASLQTLTTLITSYLEALEKIRRIKGER